MSQMVDVREAFQGWVALSNTLQHIRLRNGVKTAPLVQMRYAPALGRYSIGVVMTKVRFALIFMTTAALFGGKAGAQAPGSGPGQASDSTAKVTIPRQYEPPAGMCRIWLEGIPPSRQPAPTDCVTALRNRPKNGRVIFGESLPQFRQQKRKSTSPFGLGSFDF